MSASPTDMTAPGRDNADCRKISELLGRVGDRWTLRILLALCAGPQRFNQLRRIVEGLSQQMLTRTLKTLERDGMVSRTVFPTVPPQVEYSLTPLGEAMALEGARFGHWAHDRLPEIEAHRERYDGNRGS